MAVVPKCPVCDGEVVRLLSVSDSHVDYYRCACGHVWTVDRKTGELMGHITPLPEKPD